MIKRKDKPMETPSETYTGGGLQYFSPGMVASPGLAAPMDASPPDISSSAVRLLEDLKKETPVSENTIVGWTSVHPVNGVEFHYAAVFAGGSWYTTVGRDNENVQKIMSHQDFVAYLSRKKKNLKNVRVAVDFVELNW